MPDYRNGKIYRIVGIKDNRVYIGSTTQPLDIRFKQHYRRTDEKKKYDWMMKCNPRIELLENYPCNNKCELIEREEYYLSLYKKNNIPVINKSVARTTDINRKNKMRESYLRNRSKQKNKKLERYRSKRDEALKYQAQWYQH